MIFKARLVDMVKDLDLKHRYALEFAISQECDEYVKEACEDVVNLKEYADTMSETIESTGLKTSFLEKVDSLIDYKIDAIQRYTGGSYDAYQYESVTDIVKHKEGLLKDFIESSIEYIAVHGDIPEFNSRVMLESHSISESKKNDILTEYFEMDNDAKHIVDTYYEFVNYNRPQTREIYTEAAEGSTGDTEPTNAGYRRAQELAIIGTMAAIAIGSVIKVGEVLKLRRVLEKFGKADYNPYIKKDITPLSKLSKDVYDEDEIPKGLQKYLTWNDVNYNYKMEVYYDDNGKVVCGRVYAYTCSTSKIKFTLLQKSRSGPVAKVKYFVNGNDEYKSNYYMMAMSLEDRIAHESIGRVARYMENIEKRNNK